MILDVTGQLYYCKGDSVLHDEGLIVIIKFKEKGKIFKTKLESILVTIQQYTHSELYKVDNQPFFNTIDEYYDRVEEIYQDVDYIKQGVEERVMNYFNKKNDKDNKENRKKEIADKINNQTKIEIKLEIK